MLLSRIAVFALFGGLLASPTVPVMGASFDCGAANSPYEKAICDRPTLSTADERLAISYATAIGGLSKKALAAMRNDQRDWLAFVQRACTDDAQPLTSGSYDDKGVQCLGNLIGDRSTALEQSRMLGGHRFIIKSSYDVTPDPNEVDNPDSYWKLARHSTIYTQIDADTETAKGFNAFVAQAADTDSGDPDDTSDSSYSLAIKEVAGSLRITLESTTFWYGHGAAHGNWGISYLHYLPQKGRGLEATDIFAGDGWEATLRDAAWEQLQAQHAEWLQLDAASEIADIVTDPKRWDLSNAYGLIIQFQPYEVAAYAYGAPTITVPWEKIESIAADTQDGIRYGF